MIKDIHSVQSVVDDINDLSSRGLLQGIVVLAHRSDGGFHSLWAGTGELERVRMVGELEFVKRDIMRAVYEDK